MNIIITDREGIQRGVPVRSSFVVISISDPGRPRPRVKRMSGLRDVLYLAFHDTEPSPRLRTPASIVPMTVDHARQILQFARKHRGIETVVVHCEQGMSRSPAVAAALSTIYGLDATKILREYQPNQYVYELLLRVHREEANHA